MPKRDAGNELNHDNWEDEEEPEEAGEFKKASEEALKGRVFRKGKRRNLTEDQKKNIFAGFGGFTSSNKSAEEAFSFLGNSKPEEKKDDDNAAPKESKGDEKKSEEEGEKSNGNSKPDDLMAKFMTKKSDSWCCDVCMISNDADKLKCVACETSKPGGRGGGAPLTGSPKKSESLTPSADPLMAKFMTKGADSSKWSCDVCMISNPSDKDKCLACDNLNPKAPTASKTNNETAAEVETKPTFNFGGGGGFKFVESAANKTDSAFSSFKFGSVASQPTESSVTVGGFKFGSADEASAPPTGGFKFGSSDAQAHTATADQVAGFKFGNSSEDASSTPAKVADFKFGSTEAPSNAGTTGFFSVKPVSSSISSPFQGPTGFLFSSTEKVSGTPKKADAPTKARRKEYLASLKALNTQVTNWIKSHVDENPLVDLSPVFKDYGKHLQQLRTKFDIKSIEMGESTEKKSEEKASTEEATEQKKESAVPAMFSSVSVISKDGEKKEPFSFGVSQSGFGNLSSGFGSGTGFSFGSLNSKKVSEPENGGTEVGKDGDEEEDEAVKVEEKAEEAVVEEDALFSKKCKLFYKKEDSYTERGLGTIHLKLTAEKKVQVVVRAGTSLGNILLNVLIGEGIPVERVGKNNVMVICVPNPPIDLKADPQPTTFLIRVKTSEEADELKEKMLSLGSTETSVTESV